MWSRTASNGTKAGAGVGAAAEWVKGGAATCSVHALTRETYALALRRPIITVRVITLHVCSFKHKIK